MTVDHSIIFHPRKYNVICKSLFFGFTIFFLETILRYSPPRGRERLQLGLQNYLSFLFLFFTQKQWFCAKNCPDHNDSNHIFFGEKEKKKQTKQKQAYPSLEVLPREHDAIARWSNFFWWHRNIYLFVGGSEKRQHSNQFSLDGQRALPS